MSCNCGVLKKNLCDAGVFSLSKMAIAGVSKKSGGDRSAKKFRNQVLSDSAVFGLSGVVYDKWLSTMDYSAVGGKIFTDQMMKSVYQVVILQLADMLLMKKKFKIDEFLEDSIAVLSANYVPDMVKGINV